MNALSIGKTKNSTIQLELLDAMLTGEVEPTEAGHILMRVAGDEEILSGKEELHPDWKIAYDKHRERVLRFLPSDAVSGIESFYSSLAAFDDLLTKIDPALNKIAFLLGAGASKPKPSLIPTVKELLPQLLERARRLDRDDLNRLADYCENRKIDNIEDLLTAAHIATYCSRSPTVLKLLNFLLFRRNEEPDGLEYTYRTETRRRVRQRSEVPADVSSVAFLQDTLQVLFGLLASTMLPAKPNKAHEAIVRYSASRPGSTIVTTNYDCCMDEALEAAKQEFDYGVEFANLAEVRQKPACPTRLIKLHGSLNWFYCETCQEVQRLNISTMLGQFASDSAPFPVIGICKACGGQRRGLLVPPLAMKFDVAPPLTPLLSAAELAFKHADVIVVVGFSFADADIHISRMVSKSMQTKGRQKLIIVDPDHSIAMRVRRKFKASIPNFDTDRIVRATGDCAEIIPKFLDGALISGATARLVPAPKDTIQAEEKVTTT